MEEAKEKEREDMAGRKRSPQDRGPSQIKCHQEHLKDTTAKDSRSVDKFLFFVPPTHYTAYISAYSYTLQSPSHTPQLGRPKGKNFFGTFIVAPKYSSAVAGGWGELCGTQL